MGVHLESVPNWTVHCRTLRGIWLTTFCAACRDTSAATAGDQRGEAAALSNLGNALGKVGRFEEGSPPAGRPPASAASSATGTVRAPRSTTSASPWEVL